MTSGNRNYQVSGLRTFGEFFFTGVVVLVCSIATLTVRMKHMRLDELMASHAAAVAFVSFIGAPNTGPICNPVATLLLFFFGRLNLAEGIAFIGSQASAWALVSVLVRFSYRTGDKAAFLFGFELPLQSPFDVSAPLLKATVAFTLIFPLLVLSFSRFRKDSFAAAFGGGLLAYAACFCLPMEAFEDFLSEIPTPMPRSYAPITSTYLIGALLAALLFQLLFGNKSLKEQESDEKHEIAVITS